MSNPTNQYKDPVYPAEATKRGQIYSQTHGYVISKKGVVYHQAGHDKRTYLGFYKFYFLNRQVVDAWLKENGLLD
jgi:hypothetical protein